jgi:hypothetical protein
MTATARKPLAGYVTPTPPKATRMAARLLPARLRFLACAGVHTVPADYGHCAVCGRDWTRAAGRAWLRLHGTRAPRRRQPPETTLHVELLGGVTLHRRNGFRAARYWVAEWTWKGDLRRANLRPRVDFGYQNVSRRIRIERDRPELMWEDES